ncbi:hypothetical protein C8F04DRAFT_1089173 [Mycena alexandri]|uniref:Uncharacterized protein n=1 Tax=Mycena alexandri TaxID=1745969 RepID=A0AAD6T635_9AGAR|nr:hypothetical protein C8F04DRAFT_1089173 [Mycena alexandri]
MSLPLTFPSFSLSDPQYLLSSHPHASRTSESSLRCLETPLDSARHLLSIFALLQCRPLLSRHSRPQITPNQGPQLDVILSYWTRNLHQSSSCRGLKIVSGSPKLQCSSITLSENVNSRCIACLRREDPGCGTSVGLEYDVCSTFPYIPAVTTADLLDSPPTCFKAQVFFTHPLDQLCT